MSVCGFCCQGWPRALLSAVQDRRQRLVDQEAERRVQQPLKEGKRQVKGQQTGQKSVHAGVDGLIHADDGLQRQVVQHHIGRVNHKIVVRHTDKRHDQRTGACADECAAAGLAALVDETGHTDKERAHNKVEQLTHGSGAGAGKLDQVFDQADGNAGHRAVGIRRQQGGQLRDIQLDKGRHDGNGKFQIHQHGSYRAEHGGPGEFADIGDRVLHSEIPPDIICESRFTNPGGSAHCKIKHPAV